MTSLTLSENMLKTVFFAVNFGLWAGGLLIIATITYTIGGWNQLRSVDLTYSYKTSVVLFFVGALLSLIGGVGCFGSCNNSPNMLYAYSTLLLTLFAVEMFVVVYTHRNNQEASQMFESVLDRNIQTFNDDPNTRDSWDFLQHKFNCCGGSNYNVWFQMYGNKTVPDSCCLDLQPKCGENVDPKKIYTTGCAQQFREFVNSRMLVVTLVMIIVGLGEWLCIIVSCCLGNAIHDRDPINYRRLHVS